MPSSTGSSAGTLSEGTVAIRLTGPSRASAASLHLGAARVRSDTVGRGHALAGGRPGLAGGDCLVEVLFEDVAFDEELAAARLVGVDEQRERDCFGVDVATICGEADGHRGAGRLAGASGCDGEDSVALVDVAVVVTEKKPEGRTAVRRFTIDAGRDGSVGDRGAGLVCDADAQ